MRKGEVKSFIIFAILLVSCIGFALAEVSVKSTSIATQYAPNSTITGRLTLSLEDISSGAYLRTNFGDNISLLDLVKSQWKVNENYSCTTFDCGSSYATVGSGSETKEISFLNGGDSKRLGFLIEGTVKNIVSSSFSLGITSTAPESSTPQLFIDVLDDNSPEWSSYLSSGTFGLKYSGCYSTISHQDGGSFTSIIGPTQYCEKMSLFTAPQVSIGAYLTVDSPGSSTMELSIEDVGQTKTKGTCSYQLSAEGEISCTPTVQGKNYIIRDSGDFYVCIKETSGTGSYKLNRESLAPVCGFYGAYPQSEDYTADYEIFGRSGKFASLGTFTLNNTLVSFAGYSKNLESEISSYLLNKYGNDCSDGCVVPLDFTAGQSQDLDLDTFKLKVETLEYGLTPISSLYEVQETSAILETVGIQIISLSEANFSVPNSFGEKNFELVLVDGEKSYTLASKKISIERVPMIVSVTPSTTAGALPTEFTATLNTFGSNSTIVQYTWNFGDNTPIQTTTTRTVSHVYNQLGTFNLQVTVLNSLGLSSSAQFAINVASPDDAVIEALSKSQINLLAIESKLGTYPGFAQNAIKQILNIEATKIKLQELQSSANAAVTDEQYLSIMRELVLINLPESIEETSTSVSVPFFPSGSKINLDVLKGIGGGDYDPNRESEYTDEIVSWGLGNQIATIDHSEFSGVYGKSLAPIVNTINLNVKGISTGSAYLIIPELENIQLDKIYSKSGSYYYIPLTSGPQTVQFATSASLSPVNLPIFISPSLDEITLPSGGDTKSNIIIFVIVMGSVIVLGMTAYIFVGKWYQRKYEKYLFKDRNDLYNIINYVHRLKSKGAKEDEIEKNLRKAKWNSEQIKYVIKRYARKRIGIPGFTKYTPNK